MSSHVPFEYLKHKLWPKEGSGVKMPIWLWPLKVENRFDLLAFKSHAINHWKSFDKCYNFALYLTLIGGFHKKLWASTIVRIPISRLLTWESWDKMTFGCKFVARHREYYKGKMVASLKSGPWWILWVHVYLSFVCVSKMLQLYTDQLIVWIVQVCVNYWFTCHSP
jgi:hypothetical protein